MRDIFAADVRLSVHPYLQSLGTYQLPLLGLVVRVLGKRTTPQAEADKVGREEWLKAWIDMWLRASSDMSLLKD